MDRKYLTIIFACIVLLKSQGAYAQEKWLDTFKIPKSDSKRQVTEAKPQVNTIREVETRFSVILTLRDYEPGKIEHPDKELFIEKVKTRIQDVRTKQQIKKITIVGWADGTKNEGIEKGTLKIENDCIYVLKGTKIFDPELARLRGCDLHRKLSGFMLNNSIQLSDLIDIHDEPDHHNANGEYRKVVVIIEF